MVRHTAPAFGDDGANFVIRFLFNEINYLSGQVVGCRCGSRSAHPTTNIIKITTWQLQHSLHGNKVIDVDQTTHSNSSGSPKVTVGWNRNQRALSNKRGGHIESSGSEFCHSHPSA